MRLGIDPSTQIQEPDFVLNKKTIDVHAYPPVSCTYAHPHNTHTYTHTQTPPMTPHGRPRNNVNSQYWLARMFPGSCTKMYPSAPVVAQNTSGFLGRP
jgi:hypothetical protein